MSRLPFELSIPKPCPQDWSEMSGSAAVRHCAACNRKVHNLASLTPGQIERLMYESDGQLCARLTRRKDGSLVMNERQRSGAAATTLLAIASIPMFTAAQASQAGLAVVSGRVVSATPNRTSNLWFVIFEQNGTTRALARTDGTGAWRTEVPPGTYDLRVMGMLDHGTARVSNVALHAGEQSFGPITTVVQGVDVVSGGITYRKTPLWAIVYYTRHPLRLLKKLGHRLNRKIS